MMKLSTCLAGKDVSVGCVFGADEELGGFTTTWMVEEKECRPRRMVIVVDSAYAKIGYATKGQLVVKATLKDECVQLAKAVTNTATRTGRPSGLAFHRQPRTAMERRPSRGRNCLMVKATLKDECIQLPTTNYQLPTKRTHRCYVHLFLRRR